jgi:hypothetical protein
MYIVTYRNQGRPEKTAAFSTYEDAKESANFLKFQGAKCVKIIKA